MPQGDQGDPPRGISQGIPRSWGGLRRFFFMILGLGAGDPQVPTGRGSRLGYEVPPVAPLRGGSAPLSVSVLPLRCRVSLQSTRLEAGHQRLLLAQSVRCGRRPEGTVSDPHKQILYYDGGPPLRCDATAVTLSELCYLNQNLKKQLRGCFILINT